MDSTRKTYLFGTVLVAVGIVVALLIGLYLKTNNQTYPSISKEAQKVLDETVNISLQESGFSPRNVNAKVGQRIVWTNKTGKTASLNSDDHPTHTKFPVLNLGEFMDNQSVQIMFKTPGTYTYHNHYNPEQVGTIIVK